MDTNSGFEPGKVENNHKLIIMSLQDFKETRSRTELREITVTGEKLSCGVRRTGQVSW